LRELGLDAISFLNLMLGMFEENKGESEKSQIRKHYAINQMLDAFLRRNNPNIYSDDGVSVGLYPALSSDLSDFDDNCCKMRLIEYFYETKALIKKAEEKAETMTRASSQNPLVHKNRYLCNLERLETAVDQNMKSILRTIDVDEFIPKAKLQKLIPDAFTTELEPAKQYPVTRHKNLINQHMLSLPVMYLVAAGFLLSSTGFFVGRHFSDNKRPSSAVQSADSTQYDPLRTAGTSGQIEPPQISTTNSLDLIPNKESGLLVLYDGLDSVDKKEAIDLRLAIEDTAYWNIGLSNGGILLIPYNIGALPSDSIKLNMLTKISDWYQRDKRYQLAIDLRHASGLDAAVIEGIRNVTESLTLKKPVGIFYSDKTIFGELLNSGMLPLHNPTIYPHQKENAALHMPKDTTSSVF
ncbi:hypothetical protein JXA85_04800, partial [Candidatus Woesearchaeota archaeon]|nr:hypothetical protein [Candidatus Woesearchaeota archaeon]